MREPRGNNAAEDLRLQIGRTLTMCHARTEARTLIASISTRRPPWTGRSLLHQRLAGAVGVVVTFGS